MVAAGDVDVRHRDHGYAASVLERRRPWLGKGPQRNHGLGSNPPLERKEQGGMCEVRSAERDALRASRELGTNPHLVRSTFLIPSACG